MKYRAQVRSRVNPAELQTLTLEGEDREQLIMQLHRDGYLVVSCEAVGEKRSPLAKMLAVLTKGGPAAAGAAGRKAGPFITPLKRRAFGLMVFGHVSAHELIAFAVQLSALLEAGVPLLKSLQIVERGLRNSYFRSVIGNCINNVGQGFALGYALSQYPGTFSSVWVNLVEVGEASGRLPQVLKEIASYQDASQRVKTKVITAFFYPSILILFATGAIGFLLLKIIPKFEEIFKEFGAELPVITKVVIAVSRLLREHFWIWVIVLAAACVGVFFAYRTKQGRAVVDFIRLKTPVMGGLLLQISIVRFARSFATLLQAGVPIIRALEISGRLAQNSVVESVIVEAREAVKTGQSFGAKLESTRFFPVFMTQLVAVGEESGELARFLGVISNYYEEQIDVFLSRLTTMLEPLLLIVVGSVIGVLVISMFLPIVELSTTTIH